MYIANEKSSVTQYSEYIRKLAGGVEEPVNTRNERFQCTVCSGFLKTLSAKSLCLKLSNGFSSPEESLGPPRVFSDFLPVPTPQTSIGFFSCSPTSSLCNSLPNSQDSCWALSSSGTWVLLWLECGLHGSTETLLHLLWVLLQKSPPGDPP